MSKVFAYILAVFVATAMSIPQTLLMHNYPENSQFDSGCCTTWNCEHGKGFILEIEEILDMIEREDALFMTLYLERGLSSEEIQLKVAEYISDYFANKHLQSLESIQARNVLCAVGIHSWDNFAGTVAHHPFEIVFVPDVGFQTVFHVNCYFVIVFGQSCSRCGNTRNVRYTFHDGCI